MSFPIFLFLSQVKAEKPLIASVLYSFDKSPKYQIVDGVYDSNAVATATYLPELNKKGWDQLTITTNQNHKYKDPILAFGARLLEEHSTWRRINPHYQNMAEITWKTTGGKMPMEVSQFFLWQYQYINNQYYSQQNDYWNMLMNIQKQFMGMVQGYNDQALKNKVSQIDFLNFHTMASFGDLLDVIYYKNKEARPNFNKMNYHQILKHIHKSTHCSALIKISPDFKDLWFGHNTWFYYSATTRIFKEYKFNYSNPLQKAKSVIFSSYAATLSSNDDFYVTSENLVVIETTNSFFNTDLYDKLTPNSVLTWQRAMLSNYISSDASSWTNNFSKENSGTYNNQFMVLDLKQIDTE